MEDQYAGTPDRTSPADKDELMKAIAVHMQGATYANWRRDSTDRVRIIESFYEAGKVTCTLKHPDGTTTKADLRVDR